MTPNEYQKEALRTASGMSKEYPRILNGLMGLNGEAGECIDMLWVTASPWKICASRPVSGDCDLQKS